MWTKTLFVPLINFCQRTSKIISKLENKHWKPFLCPYNSSTLCYVVVAYQNFEWFSGINNYKFYSNILRRWKYFVSLLPINEQMCSRVFKDFNWSQNHKSERETFVIVSPRFGSTKRSLLLSEMTECQLKKYLVYSSCKN